MAEVASCGAKAIYHSRHPGPEPGSRFSSLFQKNKAELRVKPRSDVDGCGEKMNEASFGVHATCVRTPLFLLRTEFYNKEKTHA